MTEAENMINRSGGPNMSALKLLRRNGWPLLAVISCLLWIWLLVDERDCAATGSTVSVPALTAKDSQELEPEFRDSGRRNIDNTERCDDCITRVFVVGCGHSGTSLLFRSIGNMRHVRCLQKETALFVKNTEGDERLISTMKEWDNLARENNYSYWVEKTPRHVYHIEKMIALNPRPNTTKIVFIHRDGRDVAISFRARGYNWEKSVNRWVEDNEAAIPFLDSGQAMAISFEELTSKETVLKTLQSIAEYLGITVTTSELSLALLPGTYEHKYQEYCTAYKNDEEKFKDLSASLVAMLANQELSLSEDEMQKTIQKGDETDEKAQSVQSDFENPSDTRKNSKLEQHNEFRTWQMSQAWTEVERPSSRDWTKEEEKYFMEREDVQRLMHRFGYLN